ncbi:serine protease snake [Musca domestica]|uniref:Serine protease snake n=1 Tax=Musca domestica TaxID=7370 RepID=A0A9J7D5M4_MUSDO|nr:serine protease snake [Musca domestica]
MFSSNRGIVYGIVLFSSVWILGIEAQHRGNYYGFAPPLPTITYDGLGNCYVNSVGLKGHCVPYPKCSSAVQNWQYYQRMPFSCYFNGYENFVCCPEAYVITTTTRSPLVGFYSSPNNPFLPPTAYYNLPAQRRSEKECEATYSPYSRSHRRHRHRRSSNNNSSESTIDEMLEPVEEEIIQKETAIDTEVVGGITTHEDEFPYMCALGWRESSSSRRSEILYHCGCVLIARKYALTAAHCANFGGEPPKIVRIGGGDLDERRHVEMIRIRRIIQHPDYDSKYAYNDIAVVKLERSSRARPACLWANEGLPQEVLTAIGYGQTKFAGPTSNSLLKVHLNVLTNENCKPYYETGDKLPNGLDAGQICAGDPNGKMDTCQGDSGGPLLLNVAKYQTYVPYVVGLTSFGDGCATGVPSIYTRIYTFIEWIESQVWK